MLKREIHMFLKQTIVDQKEEQLRSKMKLLPEEKRAAVYSKFVKECKDPDTYAALNWSLFVGFHHLYLKQYYRAFIDWLCVFIGVALLLADLSLGVIFILVVTILELYQLFRSQIIVQYYNNNLLEKILLYS